MRTVVFSALRGLLIGLALLVGGMAAAQDRAWVQIEAQPTLEKATERARAYSGAFPDVQGYALRSGWYGILLGPQTEAAARQRLADLLRERLIPGDSFLADGRNFRDRYWPPAGEALALAPPPAPDAPVEPLAEAPADLAPPQPAALLPSDETPAEARATEADLTRIEREELQTALQWFGFYDAAIDGAFGAGTRSAMAAWQGANGAEPTGVLTTAQRTALVDGHMRAMAELGLERVSEPEAGIEIDLPLAMVAFDGYAPPFVQYRERNGSGVSVLLISQPGDEAALAGLYDVIQSLDVVPPGGERSRDERSFEITGQNGRITSFTRAELSGGLIKGFTLVWPAGDEDRRARVLAAMQAGFRAVGDRALDPGLAPLDADERQGLLTGLEVRRPALSRSGFFIEGTGTVLTTTDVLQSCTRLTIDGEEEMTLRLADAGTGLAVLDPLRPLSPPGIAAFQTLPERAGAEVAVAGYPFEDALTAPTLTFGRIAALAGLEGEPELKRLSLAAMAGDAGGPVVDGTGAVIGMMLPRDTSGARILPEDVSFARAAAGIVSRLRSEGIVVAEAARDGALPPEDLTRTAARMTVIVSCWR